MSLKNIRNGFDKIKEKGEEYFNLDTERKTLEKDVEQLKNKYRGGGTDRGVFSDRNKKLASIKNKMSTIRKNIEKTSHKLDQDIRKEMQDVI